MCIHVVSTPSFAVATQSDEHTQGMHTIFPAQTLATGPSAAHLVVNVELVAAIVAALGAGGVIPVSASSDPPQLARRIFCNDYKHHK